MSNVSVDRSGAGGGLERGRTFCVEDSGQFSKRPTPRALANAIGLNGQKLESIANGWLPAEKDLNWLVTFSHAAHFGGRWDDSELLSHLVTRPHARRRCLTALDMPGTTLDTLMAGALSCGTSLSPTRT